MRFTAAALALAAASTGAAQRPSNTSICDYYTTALLKNNTSKNQLTLLTLLVNTVVIGNYTQPNVGVMVPGILAPGMYNGTQVNLLPFFDGSLKSTNQGGDMGVSTNFLDGGGAAPLKKNMPANDTKSNQYFLLTHLYQFFGALLGCSMEGMGAFPAYMGSASMYEVHKFMDINPAQLGYFITQVALAGASFGVAKSDLEAVGMALEKTFGYRCEPPMAVIPAQGPQLQSICTDGMCPLAMNASCSLYNTTVPPMNTTSGANHTAPGGCGCGGSATSTGSGSGSSSTATMSPSSMPTAGAATVGISIAAIAGGFAALLL